MNIFSKITARIMAQNRTRTVVTIIGVVLSTAMITAVATFGASFWQFLVNYSISRDGNWHLQIQNLDAEKVKELAGSEEVEQAAVITNLGSAFFAPIQEKSPEIPYLYVQSLSEEALEMLPVELSEGRLPENDAEVIIPSYLQANEDEDQITKVGDVLELKLGERVFDGERISGQSAYMEGDAGLTEELVYRNTKTFVVVGVYDSWPGESYGGAGYDVLAGPILREDGAAAEVPGAVTQSSGTAGTQDVFLRLKHPRRVYQFADEKLAGVDGGYAYSFNLSLLRWLGVSDNDNFYTVVVGLLAVLLAVIVSGSISLIYNAFSISLRERTAEFGLLSSIGATKRQLRGAMRYEALLVSLVGIPLGILAGIGGIGVTLHFIGKAISNWIHGSRMGIALVVSPWSVLAAAVIAFGTIQVSVWIPSRRIRKISPLEAIRSNADIKIRPGEVRTGGFVFRLFGLEGMLARKNYRRDRKKYRATVVSLSMSIVLFMAAALFNIYLLQTGAFVLDAPAVELEYELYEYGADRKTEDGRKAEALIRQTEGVTDIISYKRSSLMLSVPDDWMNSEYLEQYGYESFSKDGRTPIELRIFILPDAFFASYAKNCGVDASGYQDAQQLRLLYVNEARVYNSDTQRYERIRLFGKTNEELLEAGCINYGTDGDDRLAVKGEAVLGDGTERMPGELEQYSDLQMSSVLAFIPEQMYDKFADVFDGTTTVLNIHCDNPAGTYEKIQEELRQSGLEDAGYLGNLYEAYESDRNALIAVKVLTYGFIILISLIAVANVFNTISTNLMLRRKEFAMLRSMGMSPRGLRRMMNCECLIYGMRSVCYGVLTSILLGAVIRHMIGAGADVAFLVPWRYLAAAVAGVFAVVFATMLYTMHKIRLSNIVDELKMS